MVAFTQNRLTELDDDSGAAALDAAVHAGGFETVASPAPGVEDRLVDGKVPLREGGRRVGHPPSLGVTGTIDLSLADSNQTPILTFAATRKPSVVGVGDSAQTAAVAASGVKPTSVYAEKMELAASLADGSLNAKIAALAAQAQKPVRDRQSQPVVRTEVRPDPSYYRASDPYVLVRGAGRSRRHGGDGRWLAGNRLKVRTPAAIPDGFTDLLPGAEILAGIESGAVPPETTRLAREALTLSDFATEWLAHRAAARAFGGGRIVPNTLAAFTRRFAAEAMLRYTENGAFLGESTAPTGRSATRDGRLRYEVAQAMHARSALAGVEQSPVGVTAWAQPWCPLWLEYRVEVLGSRTLDGFTLGATDLEPAEPGDPAAPAPPNDTVLATAVSRVPLTTGVARTLGTTVEAYLRDERERDADGVGVIDDDLAGALGELRDISQSADLLGASLDGVRRRMLGLRERRFLAADAAGAPQPETPDAAPVLLAGGRLRIRDLRILDTYGRELRLDPAAAIAPVRLEAGEGSLRRSARFTPPARLRVRFVGAAATDVAGAVDARIDEAEPARQVSPVCGFLLPDHVDESIEVLGPDATPLGELLVTGAEGSSGGGVVWEPAPGRPVPADAAPSTGLLADEHVLGRLATGIVRADAAARGAARADPAKESALSALLRAVDTTLWTVDLNGGAGSAQVGSIVGSPLAVVRSVVSVDVLDESADLAQDPEAGAARAAAYDELLQVGVRVRLGELTRPDDGLVAWFADDDYSQVHLVDRAIAEAAAPAGPGRGLLTEWGVTGDVTTPQPIQNDYISMESELIVHPGVPRMVTLLMLPGAAVHATSGVVPRVRAQLQRGWFATALDALVPSVRVGPVLVDPGDLRLPLVAALGEEQTLTVREGPTAWRNDAILAATQSALLPDRATVLRDGWVRVTPSDGADTR